MKEYSILDNATKEYQKCLAERSTPEGARVACVAQAKSEFHQHFSPMGFPVLANVGTDTVSAINGYTAYKEFDSFLIATLVSFYSDNVRVSGVDHAIRFRCSTPECEEYGYASNANTLASIGAVMAQREQSPTETLCSHCRDKARKAREEAQAAFTAKRTARRRAKSLRAR